MSRVLTDPPAPGDNEAWSSATPVQTFRRERLEAAGFDPDAADRLAASDADWHLAVAMLRKGCTVELVLRTLL